MARPEDEKEVWACRTFIRWMYEVQDDGQTHIVRLASTKDFPSDFKYICDCGNSYPCLHVSIAKGYHCGWNEACDPEEMTNHGVCPRCGSMAIRIPWNINS